jgi:hypothetical protein
MKKQNVSRMPVVTIILFVVAAALLVFSSIGGARAALTYFSENYNSQLEMNHIGVTLNENGTAISSRDYDSNGEWTTTTGSLLNRDLEEDGGITLGKTYPEELSVSNTGDIDEYVRVSIYKYWLAADGTTKVQTLTPDMIGLNLTGNGWVVDEDASTAERTVLYYTGILTPGATTPALTDTLTIDNTIASYVSQSTQGGTITTTYEYDGVTFQIEAQVDAVQTHNAEDAILSAWGREVSVSDSGTLSLK